jgi:hypothetical protein
MRTDGRTDMTKLIVAFRNFAKAPNNLAKATASQAEPQAVTVNLFALDQSSNVISGVVNTLLGDRLGTPQALGKQSRGFHIRGEVIKVQRSRKSPPKCIGNNKLFHTTRVRPDTVILNPQMEVSDSIRPFLIFSYDIGVEYYCKVCY